MARNLTPFSNLIFLALALISIIIVYLFRYDAVKPKFDIDDRIRITGSLGEQPKIFEGRQQLVLSGVRIYLDRFPEYNYGDKVVAEGTVAKSDYGYFLKDPKVQKLEKNNNKNFLQNFRSKLLEIFGFSLSAPFRGLAEGVVLGTKNSLDQAFYEALKETGTLHVVVASGTNISLLGGLILYLLTPIFKRRIALLSSLFFIWIYVSLIGFDPPIVRAGIMGSLVFVSLAFGKKAMGVKTLVITGVIMLLLNPLWLFDLGFQLSFAATLGILLFNDKISQLGDYISFLPQVFKTDLATTLSAQVLVTPILFFSFGTVSLISPLVNMLILWTIPIILVGGIIAGVLGIIWEPLGRVGMILIFPFLWIFTSVVEFFANII